MYHFQYQDFQTLHLVFKYIKYFNMLFRVMQLIDKYYDVSLEDLPILAKT